MKIGLVNLCSNTDIAHWSSYEKDFGFLNENNIAYKDFASGKSGNKDLFEGFKEAISDPEVSLIWFVSGGIKMIEHLDNINWQTIENSQKTFIGLSDFTHFSLIAGNHNVSCYYGLALKNITKYYTTIQQKEIASFLKTAIHGEKSGLVYENENIITGGHLGTTIFMLNSFNIDISEKTLFIEHHYIPGETLEDLKYYIHQLCITLINKNISPTSFLLGHSMLFKQDNTPMDFTLINKSVKDVLKEYFTDHKINEVDHFTKIINMK